MSSFRVYVADDRAAETEATYGRLFGESEEFHWEMAKSKKAFQRADLRAFDAILLDINLDKWDMALGEAVRFIERSCPIVLVSQLFGEPETELRLKEVFSWAKRVNFAQILMLNDLTGDDWESRVHGMREQLRLAIASHRQRGQLDLGVDDQINILHLSDPQYGDPNTDGWATMAEQEVVTRLRAIQPDIHFVAITGDIAFKGDPAEYEIAEKRLRLLLQKLWPDEDDWEERVLLVPGNHDVNLKLAAADQVRVVVRDAKIYSSNKPDHATDLLRYAFQPFRDFAWRLTGDRRWLDSWICAGLMTVFVILGCDFIC